MLVVNRSRCGPAGRVVPAAIVLVVVDAVVVLVVVLDRRAGGRRAVRAFAARAPGRNAQSIRVPVSVMKQCASAMRNDSSIGWPGA